MSNEQNQVDQGLIERTKELIKSGDLQPSGKRISEKMLEQLREKFERENVNG